VWSSNSRLPWPWLLLTPRSPRVCSKRQRVTRGTAPGRQGLAAFRTRAAEPGNDPCRPVLHALSLQTPPCRSSIVERLPACNVCATSRILLDDADSAAFPHSANTQVWDGTTYKHELGWHNAIIASPLSHNCTYLRKEGTQQPPCTHAQCHRLESVALAVLSRKLVEVVHVIELRQHDDALTQKIPQDTAAWVRLCEYRVASWRLQPVT